MGMRSNLALYESTIFSVYIYAISQRVYIFLSEIVILFLFHKYT